MGACPSIALVCFEYDCDRVVDSIDVTQDGRVPLDSCYYLRSVCLKSNCESDQLASGDPRQVCVLWDVCCSIRLVKKRECESTRLNFF